MFIIGCWLDVLLVFAPAYTGRVGGFLGIGGQEHVFTPFELIRNSFANGSAGWGLANVLWFCSMIAFGVLGIKYPRRWVFLSGACVASFCLILNFFVGGSPALRPYLPYELLGLAAPAMEICGFWVKPIPPVNEPGGSQLRTLQI